MYAFAEKPNFGAILGQFLPENLKTKSFPKNIASILRLHAAVISVTSGNT